MNVEDNPGHIRAATADAHAVGDFLVNWHGNNNAAAFALAFAFDVSSLIMLLVFGGIALVMIALVASLWIDPGSTRLASYAKFYVQMTSRHFVGKVEGVTAMSS